MKTSYSKRVLAFWLAVAMLATGAPMALAAEPDTTQPIVWAGIPGEGGEGGGITPLSTQISSITLKNDNAELTKVVVTGTAVTTDGSTPVGTLTAVLNDSIKGTDVTWSVTQPDGAGENDVKVENGTITVSDKAKDGTYTIKAGGKDSLTTSEAEAKLEVERQGEEDAVKVTVLGGQSELTIPENGSAKTSSAFTAQVLNAFGENVTPQATVNWTVTPAKSDNTGKVDIDNKGVVTVQEGATEDTVTVKATVDGVFGTAQLKLNKAASQLQQIKVTNAEVQGKTYDGTDTVPGIPTLTFDNETVNQADYTVPEVKFESANASDEAKATMKVALTEEGKKKYVFADAKTEITVTSSPVKIAKATPTQPQQLAIALKDKVPVAPSKVQDALKAQLTIQGVDGKKLEGSFSDVTITNYAGEQTETLPQSFDKAGKYTISAKFTPSDTTNYNTLSLTGIQCNITDNTVQTPTFEKDVIEKRYGDVTFTNPLKDAQGVVTYQSGNPAVATVDEKGAVTIVGAGETTITASVQGSDTTVSVSYTLKVAKRQITVTIDDKSINYGEAIPSLTCQIAKDSTDVAQGDSLAAIIGLTTNAKQYSAVGKYNIVPTLKSQNYEVTYTNANGQGVLTINGLNRLDFGASIAQIGSSKNDNYNDYKQTYTSPTNSNYFRIDVDGTDNLVSFRPHNGASSAYWIGFNLTADNSGATVKPSDLYYKTSSSGTTWTQLKDDTDAGYFHIDFNSNSMDVWFDTNNDTDNRDNIFFATSSSGANAVELIVDFDAYSGSSSSSGSTSSSSSTSKKDGDLVSTTTVDRTPTVKSRSASTTFSTSTLENALSANKREANREDADKTFIELDVKTSKTVDDTTVTMPRKMLDTIADEDTGIQLTTNQGTVSLDYRALAQIYSASSKTNVEFYMEADDDQYTLLVRDGSNDVIDLGSGEAEITFEYKLKSGEKSSDVKVYRVGDGNRTWLASYGGSAVYGGTGAYAATTTYVTDMKASYSSSKKQATFTTDELGTFLVTTDTLTTGSSGTTTTPTYPTYPTYPTTPTFVDVPSSRWSATYISKLAGLGIINGTGGGYFEPTAYVTREEFVKMLAGVAGANVSGYTSSRFPDVALSRWSAPYIAWAADRGITTGTDGGRFAPTMRITREEMATMIYRYVQSSGKTLPSRNAPATFADASSIDNWALTAVSVMQQAGIIDGNVTNGRYTFDPFIPATREECAKMLAILYDLI